MPSKFFAVPAVLAAASMTVAPAAAAELSVVNRVPVEVAHNAGVSIGIGGGWGSGWGGGGYRGRHHRRGSTAGDILTGVLILGTIAAVANAAKRNGERRSYPNPYPDPNRRYDWRTDGPSDGPQGLEGAADLCLREVERDARAREVTRVERSVGGWLVTGSMADGSPFSCTIGADGRIDQVDTGGRARMLGTTAEDRQLDDDAYRAARGDVDTSSATGPQPAYPGGPLPGEEAEEDGPES